MKQTFGFSWNDQRKFLRKSVTALMLMAFLAHFGGGSPVYAAAPGSVVINEVAWAGSVDASTDEWIELYNTSNQAISLTNWTVKDDHNHVYTIASGTISAQGYFLIEDHESAVTTATADAIISISLVNTGEKLQLFDDAGQSIDLVNSSGGAWFAGNASSKATMERINPLASGDLASNWKTSSGGSNDKASLASSIIGTPKKVNSSGQNQQGQPSQNIEILLSSDTPKVGDVVNATFKVNNAQDLFAYGFDVIYDSSVLHYQTAAPAGFLSANGTVNTSFQSALENNTEGKVVVAEARTNAVKTGINGSGDLFTLQFLVTGLGAGQSTFHFGVDSFLSNSVQDMSAQFVDKTFTVQPNQLPTPANVQAVPGQQRYTLSLSWDAVAGATAYRVYRKNTADQWILLQESFATQFTDADGIAGGGSIIPLHQYSYRVVALGGQNEGIPADVSVQETRGLKADNNHSDRVDGRDLEILARHFGQTLPDADFNALADTTYDGQVDGSDLIDIGADFAKTYAP